MFKASVVSLALVLLSHTVPAQTPSFDPAPIEKATGMKGTYIAAENVYKISKPRSNMAAIDGWKLPPFLGTSSYAAFMPTGNKQAMVIADNVLFEDEVGPAMSAALENGLEVTGLHNYFFFDRPKLYFMHIGGMGETEALATAVKKVLDAPDRIRSGQASPATGYPAKPASRESHITAGLLEGIFGKKGKINNGMFKVSYGRPVKMHGTTAGDAMGGNTWAGFAGTDNQAVVDGDFAMLEGELQPVLKSLRGAGINVVAIHNHMAHEEPRLVFLHYWGKARPRIWPRQSVRLWA